MTVKTVDKSAVCKFDRLRPGNARSGAAPTLCRGRRGRRRNRNDSSADQFHLDVGQRFVLRLRHDRGGKHGSEQAEHAEHQERAGRAHPPGQLVGHVRNHEHQRPVGERGQAGAEGLHLKSGNVRFRNRFGEDRICFPTLSSRL